MINDEAVCDVCGRAGCRMIRNGPLVDPVADALVCARLGYVRALEERDAWKARTYCARTEAFYAAAMVCDRIGSSKAAAAIRAVLGQPDASHAEPEAKPVSALDAKEHAELSLKTEREWHIEALTKLAEALAKLAFSEKSAVTFAVAGLELQRKLDASESSVVLLREALAPFAAFPLTIGMQDTPTRSLWGFDDWAMTVADVVRARAALTPESSPSIKQEK